MISGLEKMTCTGNRACAMKTVMFSLMVLLNVVQSSFLKYTIYMDYVSLVFIMLSGKTESIYRTMWSAIRSLCERNNLLLKSTSVHMDFEVAIDTMLKNAQCTFKNELYKCN